MSGQYTKSIPRRQVLKLLGTSAVLIPVVNLSGCGKDSSSDAPGGEAAPMTTTMPEAAKKAPSSPPTDTGAMQASTPPAEAVQEDMAAARKAVGELPKLALDDPQAKALSYVHDATSVDPAAQPRYKAGQVCKNCLLYTGGDKPWGGCSIFSGKAVNAEGWCSAYAPKPS